jgi:hypothetical protein
MYFYYGPNSIEIVETYKYLGILFHYSGKFSQAMSNLADKARKAYFALKSKIPYSDNLSVKSWLKLYNSMIVPIITYGSEVWIYLILSQTLTPLTRFSLKKHKIDLKKLSWCSWKVFQYSNKM